MGSDPIIEQIDEIENNGKVDPNTMYIGRTMLDIAKLLFKTIDNYKWVILLIFAMKYEILSGANIIGIIEAIQQLELSVSL